MDLLDIVKYGTPSLQEPSVVVPDVDDEIRRLVEQMGESMYENKGVGLAAPQVGRNIQLFVVDSEQVTHERRHLRAFINPEIIDESVEDEPFTEGCLSLPGIEGEVWRPSGIRIRALDLRGEPFELEADGLLARVIQHERDHLDGVLFPDRMGRTKRMLIAGKLSSLRRETVAALAGAK